MAVARQADMAVAMALSHTHSQAGVTTKQQSLSPWSFVVRESLRGLRAGLRLVAPFPPPPSDLLAAPQRLMEAFKHPWRSRRETPQRVPLGSPPRETTQGDPSGRPLAANGVPPTAR